MPRKDKKGHIFNIKDFTKGVEALEYLLKNEHAKLNFIGKEGIGLSAETQIIKRNLQKFGMDQKKFDSLTREILRTLTDVIHGHKQEVLEELKDKPEELRDYKDKYAIVEKTLVDSKLRRKFELESTYKTSILEKFDWEIITKHYEKNMGRLAPTAIGVLRFGIKSPSDPIFNIPKAEFFTIECTIDDIEALLEDLEKMKEELKKVAIGKGV